ncbi:MAG: hypothetical protein GY774_15125 [Planctomycetes bacterium]|nr:hypothetical protein [Planctomycetota bacterium]
MKKPLDKDLNKVYESFNQNHNHLRQKLMDSLPHSIKQYRRTGRISHLLAFTGEIIMKSRITKFAAAAVIIIAVMLGINYIGGSPDGASVAWSNIIRPLNDVDHVHFFEVQTHENSFPSVREGWYSHGKIRSRSCGGYGSYGAYQSFDDGETYKIFDRHNNITVIAKSRLDRRKTFYEAITEGIMSYVFSQFSNKKPELVSSDFLIYNFDPPENFDWIEKISVTVGKNSLMPIQIKTYYKVEKWYCVSDLMLFDYEELEKPIEFFDPPTETKPPHSIGRVILGGEPVEIEVNNSPGIKKAIVRLHEKFDGPVEDILIPYRGRYEITGGPIYFMEITFIIDEGYRSITAKRCPLWPGQGVKAALGGDNWPDGKHRNIRYTPVLKATDKENEFILELSCWLRTKYQF